MNIMPPKGGQAGAPRAPAVADPEKINRVAAAQSDAAGERFGDLMEVDRAWLLMLTEAGIVPPAEARAMARALIAIDREFDPGKSVDAEPGDSFSPIEPELRWRLGSDHASQLQVGRSRADIGQTLSRMRLKAEADELGARLRALAGTMIEVAARESRTIILTYRDARPLQPTTLGHYLAGVIETLLRDAARLNEARRLVDLCPMGAVDATTTGFAIDRARLAALLGFAGAARNSCAAVLSVDHVLASCSALELTGLHLRRPLRDLRHWTSFDVAQFRITASADGTVDATGLEEISHLLVQAAGKARAATRVSEAAWFADAGENDISEIRPVCEAFAAASRALDLLAAYLQHIEVDAERIRDAIRRSCVTLSELTDSVVRLEGLSPRRAQDLGARIASDVSVRDGGLDQTAYAAFAAAFSEVAGHKTKIGEEEFAELISPAHFVAIRDRLGGPAASAMGDALTALRAELRLLVEAAEASRKREAAAAAMLDDRFRALADGR